MLHDVLTSYRQSLRMLTPNFAVHLFFVLVSAGLLVPVIAGLAGIAISFSDQSALTDQDIARFLLTPAGAIGGLVVLSLIIVVIILDIAVMTAILRSGARRPVASLRRAADFTFRAVVPLALFAGHLLVRVLIVILPFLLFAGAIAFLFLRQFDINYYLSTHPPEFLASVALIGLALLIMAFVLVRRLVAWSLAMHFVLFDDVAAGEAFALSEARTTSIRWELFVKFAAWLGVRVAAGAVLAAIITALIAWVPDLFAGNLILIAVALTVVLLVAGLANMVLSAVGNGALADILNDEFERILGGRTPRRDVTTNDPGRFATMAGLGLPIVLAVAALISLVGGGVLLEQIDAEHDVAVIGHRGAAASRPENTMAAVEKAIADGADWVEIDVQETADGEVIVVHDSDFMKAAGVDLKVWDATMEDIAAIDIGSWFDPAYSSERAPRLADVLATAKGRSRVIIELKYYGHDVDLENRVIALVEEAGMEDQIATMSLKYPAVQKMLNLRPEWRSGVLAATAVGDLTGLDGDFLAVSSAQISARLLSQADKAGKDVYAWTVNDPLTMSRMISMGVDGLITDEPALARQVIVHRQALPTPQRLMLSLSDRFGLALDFTPDPQVDP